MSGDRRHHKPDIPVGEHHRGNFGVYMDHKVARLHAQNNQNQEKIVSNIFEKMVFFINGYTGIPDGELKIMIRKHGGEFDVYQGPRVTHILCTHLPHTKVNQRNSAKLARGAHQQTPIIHPNYIVDCIEARRRLPWPPYIVDGLRGHHGSNIQSFFPSSAASSSSLPPSSSSSTLGGHPRREAPILACEDDVITSIDNRRLSPPSTPEITPSSQPSQPCKSVPPNTIIGAGGKGRYDERDEKREEELNEEEEEDNINAFLDFEQGDDEDDDNDDKRNPAPPPPPPSSSSEKPIVSEEKKRRGGGCMSTKDDPDFLAKYFNQSRLSFIGTFRSRVQAMASAREKERKKPKAAAGLIGAAEEGHYHGHPTILHIDMDCFFVSVLIRDRPDLASKPLAVAHGQGGGSCSEISSCNYPARAKGVKAGMWMGEAKQLCPKLKVLQYDFEIYEEVSMAVYKIFFEEAELVQAVSCDEAYLQLARGKDGPEAATRTRQRIMESTGCPASAGISTNMLLARLATKKAKPNGQYVLREEEALDYIAPLSVKQLPGVGRELEDKLRERGIQTCGQLRAYRLGQLQTWCGEKTGKMLYNSCRGIDERPVKPETIRKSLGAEVNWGVRFDQDHQVENFVTQLAGVVSMRLRAEKVKGKKVTFKIRRSRYGPGEPIKFLGCGHCDEISRSVPLSRATSSAEDIAAAVLPLLRRVKVPPNLVRGVGIQSLILEKHGEGGDALGSPSLLRAWLSKKSEGSAAAAAAGGGGGGGGESASGKAESLVAEAIQREQGQESKEEKEEEEEESDEEQDKVAEEEEEGEAFSVAGDGEEDMEVVDDDEENEEELEIVSVRRNLQSDHLLSVSQIDLGILQELPEEVRAEYEAHLNKSKDSPTTLLNERAAGGWDAYLALSQLDPSVLQELPSAMRSEIIGTLRAHRSGVIDISQDSSDADTAAAAAAGLKHHRQRQFTMDEFRRLNDMNIEGLDPEVLNALPLHVRYEVAQHPDHQQIETHQRIHKMMSTLPPPRLKARSTASSSSSSPTRSAAASTKATTRRQPLEEIEVLDNDEEEEGEMDNEVEVMGSYSAEGEVGGDRNSSKKKRKKEKPTQSRLFIEEKVEDVRRTLMCWLDHIDTPSSQHVQLLAVYLLELVNDGSEDQVWTLMRAFRRWVEKQQQEQQHAKKDDDHPHAWLTAYRAILDAIEEKIEERERAWEQTHLVNNASSSATISSSLPSRCLKVAGLQW